MKSFLVTSCLLSSSLMFGNITVTNLDDNGAGSLREALTNAMEYDVIDFDPSLNGSILLESALPTITVGNLTITGSVDGSGANKITIDGDDANPYRIFDVQANDFVATHLNLIYGDVSGGGGAVYVGPYTATIGDISLTLGAGSSGENPLYVSEGLLNMGDINFSGSGAEVYLDTGAATVTTSNTMSLIADGTNNSQIVKNGSGRLISTTLENESPSINVTANAGILEFNGILDGSCTVQSDGTLEGIFTVNEINNNGGVVEPGSSANQTMGVMTLVNGFNQSGTLRMKISSNDQCDSITAQGSGVISGTLTIIPASGTYNPSQTFTLLQCLEGINGTFDTVNYGGLDATIHYNSTTIVLEITGTTII